MVNCQDLIGHKGATSPSMHTLVATSQQGVNAYLIKSGWLPYDKGIQEKGESKIGRFG
jgi:hypothetical protein